MKRQTRLETLDVALKNIKKRRDAALRTFRLRCKHLRLMEESGSPPHRVCIDCGATERGWHCGYQVLTLSSEVTDKVPTRAIVSKNIPRYNMDVIKRGWPPYPVGQSHPNFSKKWDYKSLTEITNA